MPDEAAGKSGKTLSARLAQVRLGGLAWCYSDMAGASGFSVPPAAGLYVHAVIHGALRIACTGGAMGELMAGEVVIIPTGEAHALRTAAGAEALPHEFLRQDRSVDVPPTHLFGRDEKVCARVLSARLSADWPADIARRALPSLLRAETPLLRADALALAGMGAGCAALLTRLAETLLVTALRTDAACRRAFNAGSRDPIEEARQLIAANPAHPWTVESLARAVGMGRSNFAAHFTASAGKAPMEVVAEHRMEHAATLLRQGRMKIIEIAELAGYGSEAAFSRRFTRHFGQSPSRMREAAREARETADQARPFRPLLSGQRKRPALQPESPAPSQDKPPRASSLFIARGRRD